MIYFVQMSVTVVTHNYRLINLTYLMHFSRATILLMKVGGDVSCSVKYLEGAPLSVLQACY